MKSSLEVMQILFLEEDNYKALDGQIMTVHVVFALNMKQGILQDEKNSHQRIPLLSYKFLE